MCWLRNCNTSKSLYQIFGEVVGLAMLGPGWGEGCNIMFRYEPKCKK